MSLVASGLVGAAPAAAAGPDGSIQIAVGGAFSSDPQIKWDTVNKRVVDPGNRFLSNDLVHYVELVSPAGLAANRSLTLPATVGAANQGLISDGTGVMSWAGVGLLAGANTWALGPNTFQSGAVGNISLIAQGASGQTAHLQEWQTSIGTILGHVDPSGNAKLASLYVPSGFSSGLNANALSGMSNAFIATVSNQICVVIQGLPGQTADLLQLRNSVPTALFKITAAGNVTEAIGTSTTLMTSVGVANVQTSAAGVGNAADTSDDTLFTYSLPINALPAAGKSARVRAWGVTAANANSKDIKLWFAGTVVADSGVLGLNNSAWSIESEISTIDITHVTSIGTWNDNGLTTNDVSVKANLVVADLTANATIVKVTGASTVVGAANDVLCYGMKVWVEN